MLINNYLQLLYREVEGILLYQGFPRPILRGMKTKCERNLFSWIELIIVWIYLLFLVNMLCHINPAAVFICQTGMYIFQNYPTSRIKKDFWWWGGGGDIKGQLFHSFWYFLPKKSLFPKFSEKKEFKNYFLKGGTGEIYTPLLPNIWNMNIQLKGTVYVVESESPFKGWHVWCT